jgi:RimJ/RimL family protein N-acetyltransferase
LLRRLTRDDLSALHAIHSREDVTRWIYWGPRSLAEVTAVLDGLLERPWEEGVVLAIEPRSGGGLVGTVSLVVGDHRQGELGFLLHPEFQGRGYATEAARAMLGLAFGQYGLHRVCGRLEPRNVGSARVLEKLGMRREALLVENEWIKGEWQSEAIYALLDREWAGRSGT